MKSFKLILIFVIAALAAGCDKNAAQEKRSREVVVYAYDSFVAEWGPAPALARLFQEKTGLTVTFIDTGDAVQTLSRGVLEKSSPQADVLLGIDNNMAGLARKEGVAEPYTPRDGDAIIPRELALGDDRLFTPFDWSYFALIFDSESGIEPPASLEDLLDPRFRGKLILMDPRTSTPGLGFVAWTAAAFGEGCLDYWKALRPNILTMAPGWSAGYGLFTQGEAPLVISYTTSPPYHIEYDNTSRYKALIFPQGHPRQIEAACLVKGAPNKKGGQAFLDFLISPEAQAVLPLTQWMYPVNRAAPLPASYSARETFIPAGAEVTGLAAVPEEELAGVVDKVTALLAGGADAP
ncbi:MAG: thiamine ABC transporter substrate-binding protein [Spirochaetaceae bacterium]|nr:thiamine ABC transporter substrate-binding protein [Spirochaetaceae bacterium]